MKRITIFSLILLGFVFNGFSQVIPIGQSSEWEATGFNNGRRVVRDCSMPNMGFYHYVWHSQPNVNNAPTGSNCDIYYACTDEMGNIVIPPTNMTHYLGFIDNRYASIAIENDGIDSIGYWRQFNTLHVVWQAILPCGGTYEVYHAKIPVGNPPVPPVQPWMPINIKNLSQTPETNSLVPAICINKYLPVPETNQHIHVVWQEENITGIPGYRGSDILYTRSLDSGLTFHSPNANAYPWSNLTNNIPNSQMPSISCSLDTFFGFPIDYSGGDCDYTTRQVHVSYNEDTATGGINVFYLQSPDDGVTWQPAQNITLFTGGTLETRDGYSNIADDMTDFVHIVFMRNVWPNDPDSYHYQPGLSPNIPGSFTGPLPGMYNFLNNQIIYWSNTPTYVPLPVMGPAEDREFPTVAFDRYLNVTVNWQEFVPGGSYEGDYEIMRIFNPNNQAPSRPLGIPLYGIWSTVVNDSLDNNNDDLFPNLAHKKASMYLLNMPDVPGYTQTWTKTIGHGPTSATATSPKTIHMSNNVSRDPAVN